jgi:polyisoprenoid-binding protein YceI
MSPAHSATSSKTPMWKIDPAHTHVEFAVKHLTFATVRGRFRDVSGAMTVAGDDFSSTG